MNKPIVRQTLFLLCFLLVAMLLASVHAGTSVHAEPSAGGQSRPAAAQDPANGLKPVIRESGRNDLSPPLRTLTPLPVIREEREVPNRQLPGTLEGPRPEPFAAVHDPVLQTFTGPTAMPAPISNFEGIDNILGALPPDPNGDIGPEHYLQMVNTSFAIWNRAGTLLYGPASIDTLWVDFGGPCEAGGLDPIVLYDQLAERWLMSQMIHPNSSDGPFYQCIAISQTGNPTGAWYRYEFLYSDSKMNDYPKLAVWPDGYYMTANQFYAKVGGGAGQGVVAFERDKMMEGLPARSVYFDLFTLDSDLGGMLPGDLDGPTPPPDGAPNHFVRFEDDAWGASTDQLQLWEFHVDWSDVTASSFAGPVLLPTAPLDSNMCGYDRNCIPQPAVEPTSYLDVISDRLMFRSQYRNFGDHQTLMLNQTVDVDDSDHAGIRWYELRNKGGVWSIYQQGTYAPDTENRWMGSIAMDGSGDIALGYSVSGAETYPSIRYAGRLADDPLNTLPQAEASLIAGGGSQTSSSGRWGDYSSMSVDPLDDCTFWYTQEYYAASSERDWQTHIGSFRFPTCTGVPTGSIQGQVTDAATGEAVANARITAHAFTAISDGEGAYRFLNMPVGTYAITASAYGYYDTTITDVSVSERSINGQDLSLAPLPRVEITGMVRDDSGHGWPLYARIDVSGHPDSPFFTNPETGEYAIDLQKDASFHLTVSAISKSYLPAEREIITGSSPELQDFALAINTTACNAPGYSLGALYTEDFEENDGGFQAEGANKSWEWGQPISGPGNAHSGDNVWGTNLDGDYRNGENGFILSPSYDLSAYAGSSFHLSWWQWLVTSDNKDLASVEVSADGGASWSKVFGPAGGPVNEEWTRHVVTLDASYAVADFRLRFTLQTDFSDVAPGFYVDDIIIYKDTLSCQMERGGLVVGNVYDKNTASSLDGALVTSNAGAGTASFATPQDPAMDDGFYTLFAPDDTISLSATKSGGYGIDVYPITLTPGTVIRQDFQLPAGLISAAPQAITATVELGSSAEMHLVLDNLGTAPASFQAKIMGRGVTPLQLDKLPSYKRRSRTYRDPSQTAPADILAQGLEPEMWGQAASIPSGPRYRAAGATCDGESYYVFGGGGMRGILDETWQFQPATGSWQRRADMPKPLLGIYAACIDDLIYVVGGYDGTAMVNDFYIYDTVDDTWLAGTWPRADSPMVTAWHSKLYAITGTTKTRGETWVYDPDSGDWEGPVAVMPVPVNSGGIVAVGDYIYVVGGHGADGPAPTVQRYDPVSATWDASGPDLPNGRMNPIVAWYGDLLYTIGGGGNGSNWTPFSDTLALDPNLWPAGAWTDQNATIPTPVLAQAHVCASGRINAVGGVSNGGLVATNQYLDEGADCHDSNLHAPWLSVAPGAGVIAAGEGQTLTLHFDASIPEVSQPGKYLARLQLREDTPYGATIIPVTMTVVQTEPAAIGDVRVTNIRDSAATLSWITDIDASGWLRYGADPTRLDRTAYDVRGSNAYDDTHYVTLTNLQPNTTYYVEIHSGITVDDNESAYYRFTTGPTLGIPPSDTLYGQVLLADATTPAAGTLLYLSLQDGDGSGSPGKAAPLSALTDENGYWSANLGNARTLDLQAFFAYSRMGDRVGLEARSGAGGSGCPEEIAPADGNPAPTINLTPDGCPAIFQMTLHDTWNFVALPLAPLAPPSDFDTCTDMNEQGGSVSEIDRWYAQDWNSHICGLPHNDFDIELGAGYFVRNNTASTWRLYGEPPAEPVPLALKTGWTAIGVPHSDDHTASTLCNDFIDQGVVVAEIDRWADGGWEGHICGLGFNDFPIKRQYGYFVKSANSGIVIPSQKATPPGIAATPRLATPPQPVPAEPLPPRHLRLTNLRDTSAALSWTTAIPAAAYVTYGETPELGRLAFDVRGVDTTSRTHYVILRHLKPQTTYYYQVHSGAPSADAPLQTFVTASSLEQPPASQTVFGQVFLADGSTTAAGAIVYLAIQDSDGQGSLGRSQPMSALVDAGGYWHANLGNAREQDSGGSFVYSPEGDLVVLEAEGADAGWALDFADASDLRPAAPLILREARKVHLPVVVW